MEYDVDNHLTQWTDPNGTVCAHAFDGLDRLLSRAVTRGPGVRGAVGETHGYDGVSRRTLLATDDGAGNPVACLFAYDSLDNPTKDQQGALSVDSVHDGVSNKTQCTYPGGFSGPRRVLTLAYDDLNRHRSVSDGSGPIATRHYKGPHRLERRTYGNDASPISRVSVGYDAHPRPVALASHGAAAPRSRISEYGYDREHHRLFEKRGMTETS